MIKAPQLCLPYSYHCVCLSTNLFQNECTNLGRFICYMDFLLILCTLTDIYKHLDFKEPCPGAISVPCVQLDTVCISQSIKKNKIMKK